MVDGARPAAPLGASDPRTAVPADAPAPGPAPEPAPEPAEGTSTEPPEGVVPAGGPDEAQEGPPPETRRERQRRETVEEIKAAARQQLTLASSSQLSLRAVARDVGLTPSAIYRYFQSQQELVGAVAADAFASATAAMSREDDRRYPSAERLRGIAYAYRAWARDHKAEFNLMFSTDMAELVAGPGAVDTDTLGAFFALPLDIYASGVAAGDIHAVSTVTAEAAPLTPQLLEWIEAAYPDLTTADLNLLLSSWSSFHGFVVLELFGHLGRFYADGDLAFERHLQVVLASMGLPTDRAGA